MDLLQINKFASLHNGRSIVFCKTDHLLDEFKQIRKQKHNLVLISGNSDRNIDQNLIDAMPDNISKWYCQNVLISHERVQVIPLGLENTLVSKRKGHGISWEHAVKKVETLTALITNGTPVTPDKLLYSNFNEQTNPAHRTPLKQLSKRLPHITWDEPSLDYSDFTKKVLEHEATLCPTGNGLDTHRIYEVLYAGRVAVTIKEASSPLYQDVYDRLPVVVLENIEQLEDVATLRNLIKAARLKQSSMELLDFGYWEKLILDDESRHVITKQGTVPRVIEKIFRKFII